MNEWCRVLRKEGSAWEGSEVREPRGFATKASKEGTGSHSEAGGNQSREHACSVTADVCGWDVGGVLAWLG